MKTYTKSEMRKLIGVFRNLNHEADPELKSDILECLIDIKSWKYYGETVDGEKPHGKLMVANSSIEIITECLCIEGVEKYFEIWNEYPNSYIYWKGDISEKRLKYLLDLSAMDGVLEINVPYEDGTPAFKMIYGTFKPVRKEGSE